MEMTTAGTTGVTRTVAIPSGPIELQGELELPEDAAGVVLPALASVGLDEIRDPRDDHRLFVP